MCRSAPDRTDGQGRSKKEERVKEEKESKRKSNKFHKEENSKKRMDEKIEKTRTKSGKDGSHRRLKGYKVHNRSFMQRNFFLLSKFVNMSYLNICIPLGFPIKACLFRPRRVVEGGGVTSYPNHFWTRRSQSGSWSVKLFLKVKFRCFHSFKLYVFSLEYRKQNLMIKSICEIGNTEFINISVIPIVIKANVIGSFYVLTRCQNCLLFL